MFSVVPYLCPACKRSGLAPLSLADVPLYCIDCGTCFRVLKEGFNPVPRTVAEETAKSLVGSLADLLGENAGPVYYRLVALFANYIPLARRAFKCPAPSMN